MEYSSEVFFQFSIVGETNPSSSYEQKRDWLKEITKLFESYSEYAKLNIIEDSSERKKCKIQISMPKSAFIKQMQVLGKTVEMNLKNSLNKDIYFDNETINQPIDIDENNQIDYENKPFLTLLVEFAKIQPRISHFINEVYRNLGKNLYFETFQNGVIIFFGTISDFYYFIDQGYQLLNQKEI